MAEGISSNQDLFTCPICLDILKDPVTVNCGHNYCKDCIKDYWDLVDQKGVYSCPQCRQCFTPRPVLEKNNVFSELLEQFRRIQLAAVTPPAAVCAAPGDVECDVCAGRKLKAVKSCLDCLLSYCETHFKAHNDVNPGRKHSVVDATGPLQERICTQHEKPFEIFCRTDQSCVCVLCMLDEHKGHDTVSASAERKKKQTNLIEGRWELKQRIQDGERKLQEITKAVETLKGSAQTAVEDSDMVFTAMICSIEKLRSEVTELIRAQEKAEVSQAEGLLKRLEQEIAELKSRDAELEQLLHTEDHIHFLKTFQSLSTTPESKDFSSICVNQTPWFEAVKKSVSTLKEQLEYFCKEEVVKLSAGVTEVQTILPCVPKTREELLQYSCHFTLDPNTAHRELHLSEGDRMVERGTTLRYPDHPERFDEKPQVLCREGVSGRCCWEVKRSGSVDIVVSSKNIRRKGKDSCEFGCNPHSWSLRLGNFSSCFYHNNQETKLCRVRSSRIGVYVDHRAGTLAFYSISDTKVTLLHQIQTTFTDPIYPGFWLTKSSSVQLL